MVNPTVFSLEEKLAALEGAQTTWAFSSGMAAEAALFIAHGRKGIVCIDDAYGGTMEFLSSQLPELNISTGSELDGLKACLKAWASLIFFETPINPTLEVLDIWKISDMAYEYGALVAVDNTVASPVNQSPLALGADFVIHSATKYLGDHSALPASLMGSKELLAPVWNWRKNLGTMIAPETASLLARSLRHPGRAGGTAECYGANCGRSHGAPSESGAGVLACPVFPAMPWLKLK